MANKDLLPPDEHLLLPADDIGSGGQGLGGRDDDVFDQMSVKVAAGARILGAKASEIAAHQGPILKEQAHKFGGRMLDVAAQARDRAEEAAREASTAFKDPALRQGFWQSYKRHILIGAGALAIIVGGGYAFGVHQETKTARDAVDAYLIRNHLGQLVRYRDVLATPFAAWRLSGVELAGAQPASSIEIGSLKISGLDAEGRPTDRLELAWSDLSLPAERLAGGEELAALAGSGFHKLRGEGHFGWTLDDKTGELDIKSSGSFADAGGWDFNLSLVGLASGRGAVDPLVLLTEGGLTALLSIELKSLSGSVDLSGLARRGHDIPRTGMPADGDRPLFEMPQSQLVNSLIEAGMTPSDARESAEALGKFAKTGSRLTFKSQNDHPVRVVQTGNFLMPVTLNLPALLAAMKLS